MTRTEPPGFFFHPDAVEASGKTLVGRRSAGQSMIRGFAEHFPGDALNVVTETAKGQKAFQQFLDACEIDRPITGEVLRYGRDFTRMGTIFFPVPGFQDADWRRQRFNPAACSLVGITHTVSTRNVIEQVHGLMSRPVEPWDAIICTSRAVKSVVERQFELEVEYFKKRFGAQRVPVPQLPVIPLGIDSQDFQFHDADRKRSRKKYKVEANDIVIMTMGRWTVAEKANPIPLFQVVEALAQKLDVGVHLWQVGWASNEIEEKNYRIGAERYCPSVTVRMIDGRNDAVRHSIWSGADIFTLPVDNIQETFGIVPIEAMAVGLPVVMPDWNGFKDTVVDGETGFLVPTRMARTGAGSHLAKRFADGTEQYLQYLSLTSHFVSIDQKAYLDALERLATNPELRAKMGAAGRERVAAHYDIKPVVKEYVALADELAEQRKSAVTTTAALGPTAINPIEVDPFDLYKHYPTAQMGPDLVIEHRNTLTAEGLAQLDEVNGRTYYDRKSLPDSLLLRIAALIETERAIKLTELMQKSEIAVGTLETALLFLAKYNFIALPPAPNGVGEIKMTAK